MKRKLFTPFILSGTYGNLVFYRWRGLYCVRTRSTLTARRVKYAAGFRTTMQYARRLGRASRIASKVYRQLPDGWKLHSLYRRMTGIGTRLLKACEQPVREIERALWQYLASVGFKAAQHNMQHPVPVTLKLLSRLPELSGLSFPYYYQFGNRRIVRLFTNPIREKGSEINNCHRKQYNTTRLQVSYCL